MPDKKCSSCNRREATDGLKTCGICRTRIRKAMSKHYKTTPQYKCATAGRERRRMEDVHGE